MRLLFLPLKSLGKPSLLCSWALVKMFSFSLLRPFVSSLFFLFLGPLLPAFKEYPETLVFSLFIMQRNSAVCFSQVQEVGGLCVGGGVGGSGKVYGVVWMWG